MSSKKIDINKLTLLFNRLKNLCTTASALKENMILYCTKEHKSFIFEDNPIFLDGLHHVITCMSSLPLKKKSKNTIRNSSSTTLGNKIDYELNKFAIMSHNSFDVCLFSEDVSDTSVTFSEIESWLPNHNTNLFHDYTRSIIEKLLEEKIVPLFSQVPIINTEHRIISAIDLIGINVKTLTPVVIEVKTGFDSRVYGQGEYYLFPKYGSNLKMCQKTAHLLQLFYYSKWLKEQGFDTLNKDHVVVANDYANGGVDKWFSIPKQWTLPSVSDTIYTAFGQRDYIVDKEKTDRRGRNQSISKVFRKLDDDKKKKNNRSSSSFKRNPFVRKKIHNINQ